MIIEFFKRNRMLPQRLTTESNMHNLFFVFIRPLGQMLTDDGIDGFEATLS